MNWEVYIEGMLDEPLRYRTREEAEAAAAAFRARGWIVTVREKKDR